MVNRDFSGRKEASLEEHLSLEELEYPALVSRGSGNLPLDLHYQRRETPPWHPVGQTYCKLVMRRRMEPSVRRHYKTY